ncbi:general secretion pathway protein GspL [Escherichia coli]|nr:general secretion pathway protein GspL [Escherichia coli]EEW9497808.1 general secretion pathway protein GspL [Escherichia coli]EFC2072262.1 general secretion pathway protein GspL [Escherichia coli]EFN9977343.1 general secretion pathway protein GspL [Escherichia coli]EFO0281673.1 general secretion pathway protein GspL [Escherichia coli]
MSINIDGRDCCQTGQPSQDVTDGALTFVKLIKKYKITT